MKKLSLIRYIGGKYNIIDWIVSHFPKHYNTYVEVFGGSGSVLLNKPISKKEVYNDIDMGLYSLFQTVKNNPDELIERLHQIPNPYNKNVFLQFKHLYNNEFKNLQEIDKSFIFFVMSKMSFSGFIKTGFSSDIRDFRKFDETIYKVHERLKNVKIKCMDFERCIKKYDSEDTFFYIDPPYLDLEFMYNTDNNMFTISDHERLRDTLQNIKSKFALSYYFGKPDECCNSVLELWYSGFYISNIVVSKNSSDKKHKNKGNELLLTNYKTKDSEIIE